MPVLPSGCDLFAFADLLATALAVLAVWGCVAQTFLELVQNLALLAVQCLWLVAVALTISYAIWRSARA